LSSSSLISSFLLLPAPSGADASTAQKAATTASFDNYCPVPILLAASFPGDSMSLTPDLIAALTAVDTPTICNALEVAAPGRRSIGFNRSPLTCPFPAMKPVVGHARTATVRSREAGPASDADKIALRLAYYEYIERGPRPSLALIQDIDGS
jgi:hypothetical protein